MVSQTPGDRLREFAKKKFGTLTAFGEACDLSPSEVTYYVKDQREPKADMLQRFQSVGLSIDWYLSGFGSMEIGGGQDNSAIDNAEFTVMNPKGLKGKKVIPFTDTYDELEQKLREMQDIIQRGRHKQLT